MGVRTVLNSIMMIIKKSQRFFHVELGKKKNRGNSTSSKVPSQSSLR